MENLPFANKIGSKTPKRNQAKEMEVLFIWNHSTINVGRIFTKHDSALLFLVLFKRTSFNPHFTHYLGCNPRIGH